MVPIVHGNHKNEVTARFQPRSEVAWGLDTPDDVSGRSPDSDLVLVPEFSESLDLGWVMSTLIRYINNRIAEGGGVLDNDLHIFSKLIELLLVRLQLVFDFADFFFAHDRHHGHFPSPNAIRSRLDIHRDLRSECSGR